MKVLHYLDTVGRGGAEVQTLDVCRNAASAGLEITLVTCGGPLESEFRETGVDVIRLRRRLPLDLYFASQIRKIVKEKSIEIVHGHQAVEGLHLYFATRGIRDVAKVLTFEGFVPGRKNRAAARLLAPRMTANISVSNSLLNYIRDGLKIADLSNFHVIHNGADTKRLVPAGRSIKHELGLPDRAVLAGMIGNFTPDRTKDQLTVCRALPVVLERFADLHFVFAGKVIDGAEAKAADCINFCLENQISDRVHFLGSRNDVPEILSELDLFVFSSFQEGFPIAVCEAMLAGVPMIASDIAPLREATGDGTHAALFKVGDSSELAASMAELLHNQDLRKQIAFDAQKYAETNFSIAAHLKRIRELYEAVGRSAKKERKAI